MSKPTTYLDFQNRDQWRSWLDANHATRTEAWLALFKAKFSNQGLTLDESVEEALCYGWIDGTLRPLDEKRYILRFSPRKRNSVWSMNNIRRVEKLIAAGKMNEAGRLKIVEAMRNGEWDAAIRREQVDIIPKGLERELRKVEGAIDAYRSLPDSHKKRYIFWLQRAKRDETKRKRIQKIVEEVLNLTNTQT